MEVMGVVINKLRLQAAIREVDKIKRAYNTGAIGLDKAIELIKEAGIEVVDEQKLIVYLR